MALSVVLAAWFATMVPTIADGGEYATSVPWIPGLGINLSFRVDGLSLLFALMISGIGAIIFLYSTSYLAGHPQLLRFYLFLGAFKLSMLGLVLTDNLVTLFVFWELTTITSYLLIGFDHTNPDARRSALQGLLVTSAGALAMLAGVVLIGHVAGTYEISEIRALGTPASERVIADHSLGLENAVVQFDNDGVIGNDGGDSNQTGLSSVGGTLQWIDNGDADPALGPGGAIAWGNNNSLAVTFDSRPIDISNYTTAEVTIVATGAAGAVSEIGVEFFATHADRESGNAFAFAGTSLLLPVDGVERTLEFSLADLAGGTGPVDLDLVQWIGINVDPHAGGDILFNVSSVVLTTIPEPSALGLIALAGLVVSGVVGRQK